VRWTGPAGAAWASPAISGMPTTRRQLRSRSPSSMTGKAGDWAPSCWRRCPTAPVRKESAVSPPWPTPVTWPWPRCSATPVPASSVAGRARSNTRSCWPAGRKRTGCAYRGLRGRRRRRLFRRLARPGRSGCALYRATPDLTNFVLGWMDIGGPDPGRFTPLPGFPVGREVFWAAW
jgi:hypothetical protein